MTWCAPVSVRPSIDALTTTWWKYGPFGSLIGPPPELAVGVHETTAGVGDVGVVPVVVAGASLPA